MVGGTEAGALGFKNREGDVGLVMYTGEEEGRRGFVFGECRECFAESSGCKAQKATLARAEAARLEGFGEWREFVFGDEREAHGFEVAVHDRRFAEARNARAYRGVDLVDAATDGAERAGGVNEGGEGSGRRAHVGVDDDGAFGSCMLPGSIVTCSTFKTCLSQGRDAR